MQAIRSVKKRLTPNWHFATTKYSRMNTVTTCSTSAKKVTYPISHHMLARETSTKECRKTRSSTQFRMLPVLMTMKTLRSYRSYSERETFSRRMTIQAKAVSTQRAKKSPSDELTTVSSKNPNLKILSVSLMMKITSWPIMIKQNNSSIIKRWYLSSRPLTLYRVKMKTGESWLT